MKITIQVDGGEAQVSGPGQAPSAPSSSAPASSEPPPDVLARASATGAIAAGPAPSMPLGPGAPMQMPSAEATAPPVGQGNADMAAGAAAGAAPEIATESPIAEDDVDEEGD